MAGSSGPAHCETSRAAGPEGQRVAGLAAVGLVVGEEGVEPAEEKQDLAGLQDVAPGAAELVEQARAVAEVGEGALEEIPRLDRFAGGRGGRGFADERRGALPRALEGGLQLGVLVGDLLEEADGLGEAGAAVVVAEEEAGGAVLAGLLEGQAVRLADEDDECAGAAGETGAGVVDVGDPDARAGAQEVTLQVGGAGEKGGFARVELVLPCGFETGVGRGQDEGGGHGNVMRKVAPGRSMSGTMMVALCSCKISAQTARPRPMPLVLVETNG